MFGKDLYPTIYDKAAAYLFHIVQNHPFNDANKRTGFGATYLFLKANRVPILLSDEAFENLVIEVAKGKVGKEEISRLLEHGE
jgi:death on curing protein